MNARLSISAICHRPKLPVIGHYIISRRQLRVKAHRHYPLSLEIQPPGFFQDTMRKCLKSRGVGLSPEGTYGLARLIGLKWLPHPIFLTDFTLEWV
jgi:hypothetical protein